MTDETIYYAGFGSRKDVPPDVLRFMSMLASTYRGMGWRLRSGRSGQCDLAFERSAYSFADLFMPWPDFPAPDPPHGAYVARRPTRGAYTMARHYHPRWDRCDDSARSLLARNCHIILGRNLTEPARVAVCWSRDGSVDGAGKSGGTAHALRIAYAHDVKVYNLAIPEHVKALERMQWGVLKGCERPAARARERA